MSLHFGFNEDAYEPVLEVLEPQDAQHYDSVRARFGFDEDDYVNVGSATFFVVREAALQNYEDLVEGGEEVELVENLISEEFRVPEDVAVISASFLEVDKKRGRIGRRSGSHIAYGILCAALESRGVDPYILQDIDFCVEGDNLKFWYGDTCDTIEAFRKVQEVTGCVVTDEDLDYKEMICVVDRLLQEHDLGHLGFGDFVPYEDKVRCTAMVRSLGWQGRWYLGEIKMAGLIRDLAFRTTSLAVTRFARTVRVGGRRLDPSAAPLVRWKRKQGCLDERDNTLALTLPRKRHKWRNR